MSTTIFAIFGVWVLGVRKIGDIGGETVPCVWKLNCIVTDSWSLADRDLSYGLWSYDGPRNRWFSKEKYCDLKYSEERDPRDEEGVFSSLLISMLWPIKVSVTGKVFEYSYLMSSVSSFH